MIKRTGKRLKVIGYKSVGVSKRDRLGRFLPGRSGNPAGRPRNMERRQRFIEAYIATVYRGARAARLAGCPPAGARVAACRMLREPDVRAAIDAEWRARQEQRERRRRELTQFFETARKRGLLLG